MNYQEYYKNTFITNSDIKKQFKLTDENLVNNPKKKWNDFYIQRYCLADIIELTQDLLKTQNITDKQRQTFLKQIKFYDDQILEKKELDINKKYIKNYLKDIICKSDLGPNGKNYIKKVVENQIDDDIDRLLNKEGVNIASIPLELISVTERKIKLENRKSELNDLIEKDFISKIDQDKAKSHKLYIEYVHRNIGNVGDVYGKIKYEIDYKNNYDKRHPILVKTVNEKIPKKYHWLALKDKLCNTFYNSGSDEDLSNVITIFKDIVGILTKKEIFDRKLRDKNLPVYQPFYDEYLTGFISEDEAMNSILNEFNILTKNYEVINITEVEYANIKVENVPVNIKNKNDLDKMVLDFYNGKENEKKIDELDGIQRTYLHLKCEKLGLNHITIGTSGTIKSFSMSKRKYKPNICFETDREFYNRIEKNFSFC